MPPKESDSATVIENKSDRIETVSISTHQYSLEGYIGKSEGMARLLLLGTEIFKRKPTRQRSLKTNGSIIQQATGLAPSTVKNALNKAQKLGFITGEKGKGGRWKSYLSKSITPLGYALIASKYFQKVISNSTNLSVLTSTL